MNREVSFSEEFMALWDADSPVRQCWSLLDTFYEGLSETAAAAATLLDANALNQLDSELKAQVRPMEEMYVSWVNLLWARIILRTQLKVRDSLALLFHACNSASGYGAALASRAIIEHVALLEYFASRIPWRGSSMVSKDAMLQFTKDIQRLSFGSRFDWDKIFSDAGALQSLLLSGSWSRPRDERIPDIGELIGALDSSLFDSRRLAARGQIQFTYSVLCDVVHPSWGGDFVYSPRMYRDMNSSYRFDEHLKLQITLFCLPVVEVVGHLLALCDTLHQNQARAIL